MTADDALVGQTLGPYRVQFRIGSGATGVVYRATPTDGGDPVALKVLHENLGSISGLERRFQREARVLQRLSHKNIVKIMGFGMEGARTFIAMELLVGSTLEDHLEQEALAPEKVLELYEPILEALSQAHGHEIVHRDLKPANVFVLDDGSVKLLDFGLAKMLSYDDTVNEGTLTRKGRIVGTPAYMAPEQITGVFIDVRADIYALGVMLFELLADRRPFLYERRSELLRAHLLEPIPDIEEARAGLEVKAELRDLLMKCLAKDAEHRFQNGTELLEALRALPKSSVALRENEERVAPRIRTGPSSAVISAVERRQITESAGLNAVAPPSRPPPRSSSLRESERETHEPGHAPQKSSGGTVLLLFAALVLFGVAAALWAGLMLINR